MQQTEFFDYSKLGRVVFLASRLPDGWMLSRMAYRPGQATVSDINSGALRTSRGNIRRFRNLETVATVCHNQGVENFEVVL